jgi:hypothetical protein
MKAHYTLVCPLCSQVALVACSWWHGRLSHAKGLTCKMCHKTVSFSDFAIKLAHRRRFALSNGDSGRLEAVAKVKSE